VQRKLRRYSYSALNTYISCSLKYYFQYVLRIYFTEVPIAAFLGQCVHDTIEYYHLNDNKPTLSNLINYFTNKFEEGFLLDDIKTHFPMHKQYSYDMGLRAINQFITSEKMSQAKPFIYMDDKKGEIPAVELYFKVPVNEDVYLAGLIDLAENRNKKLIVIDHKTSSKDYTDLFIDTSLQLTIYAYAARYLLKQGKFKGTKAKKEYKVVYNIFIKPKSKSELKIIERKISDEDIDNMISTVEQVDTSAQNNIFIPANNDQCEAFGGCAYKEICVMYQKRKGIFKSNILDVDMLKNMYKEGVEVKS